MKVPKTYNFEDILDRRTNPKTKRYEYLIKWEGYSSIYNTWEPSKHMITEEAKIAIKEFNRAFNQKAKRKKNLDTTVGEKETNSHQISPALSASCNEKSDYQYTPIKRKRLRKLKKNQEVIETTAKVVLSMTENTRVHSASSTKEVNQELFAGIELKEPNLELDRAAKIIGCKTVQGSIMYAVLFKKRLNNSIPMIRSYSHKDLEKYKPDLLYHFLLTNSRIS